MGRLRAARTHVIELLRGTRRPRKGARARGVVYSYLTSKTVGPTLHPRCVPRRTPRCWKRKATFVAWKNKSSSLVVVAGVNG